MVTVELVIVSLYGRHMQFCAPDRSLASDHHSVNSLVETVKQGLADFFALSPTFIGQVRRKMSLQRALRYFIKRTLL